MGHPSASDRAAVLMLLQASRREVDELLSSLAAEFEDAAIRDYVGYAVSAGRRFRAFLTRVCFQAAGGHGDHVRFAMGAVELLHKASLVHDDIVDSDDLRRGRETVHRRFGVREAIVIGDLVASLAFDLIGRMAREDSMADLLACYEFLSGGYRATARGEMLDLLMERRGRATMAESESMLCAKSGWLIATACALGAAAAGAPRRLADRLHRYGLAVGTGFQIVNDLNSLTSVDAASKGVLGSDVIAHKQSVPVAVALSAAGPEADELRALWARTDLSAEDADRALTLIQATGAIDLSRARAAELLAQAAAHLNDLPETPYRDLLASLPTSTLTEDYWRETD